MAYKGFDLTGKVSLVTGGNGGIGFGMADAMAEAGADICIWGTRKEKNDAAVEKLKRHGRKVHAQIVDVGDEKQVIDAFAETVKVMGHVDNCVANAGVSGRGKGSILEMDYEEWRRVTRVNLDGVFFTFRAAAKQMVAQKTGGKIVNVGSTSGFFGRSRAIAYTTAKAGVANFTRSLAVQLAKHKIRVNCVVPNKIGSPVGKDEFDPTRPVVNLAGRAGVPMDLARAILFLASDESEFIVGDMLFVDGGLAAMMIGDGTP